MLLSIRFPLRRSSVPHLSKPGDPKAAALAHKSTLCQFLLLWKDMRVWKAKIFQVFLTIYILVNWGADSGIRSKCNNWKNNYCWSKYLYFLFSHVLLNPLVSHWLAESWCFLQRVCIHQTVMLGLLSKMGLRSPKHLWIQKFFSFWIPHTFWSDLLLWLDLAVSWRTKRVHTVTPKLTLPL